MDKIQEEMYGYKIGEDYNRITLIGTVLSIHNNSFRIGTVEGKRQTHHLVIPYPPFKIKDIAPDYRVRIVGRLEQYRRDDALEAHIIAEEITILTDDKGNRDPVPYDQEEIRF